MTMKRVDQPTEAQTPPPVEMPNMPADVKKAVKFSGQVNDEDLTSAASLRTNSEPWKSRGETTEQSLEALTKLRPFIQVAKLQTQVVGYVTVERDGPVPGAAYMRNIVVKPEVRRNGVGAALLDHALQTARDMHRKTLALRVDPANAPAVSFYRSNGFTTVATVVSKKSGKLRLLMSREL
ncbi:MAG: GNAT family N-acetyltransferase [Myxococcaceae bacterium]